MQILKLNLVFGFIALFAFRLDATYLYVSPHGDDVNPGTEAKPVKSLNQALEIARTTRDSQTGHSVTIEIADGEYFVSETISFTSKDSNTTIKAAPNATPRFYGGIPIREWVAVGQGVFKAQIPEGLQFHQLFENEKAAHKACFPNEGYLLIEKGVSEVNLEGESVPSKKRFHYETDDLPEWTDWTGAEIYIWAAHDWFANLLPVESIDRESEIYSLQDETLTPIFVKNTRRYYIQGTQAALDASGEFWYDSARSELYYQPFALPISEQLIFVSSASRLFELKGDSIESPIRNIHIEGITFNGSGFTDKFVETKGTHGETIWNEPANKNGLLYLENAVDCSVTDCRILNAGFSGIACVWGARNITISGNEISNCGFHGVLLSGFRSDFGAEMDLNRNNNVSNNWIHNCGRNIGHGGGIFLWASGHNQITHNAIHDMPRYGICLKGQRLSGATSVRWNGERVPYGEHYRYVHSRSNYIAYNDIFNCSLDSEDNGFISGWGTGKGNVIYNNAIHNSHRSTLGGLNLGIYLDDATDYTVLEKNLIFGFTGGTRIFPLFAKGVHNRFYNNVIVAESNSEAAIRVWEGYNERTDHHVYERNIVYVKDDLTATLSFRFGKWSRYILSMADHNLYYSAHGSHRLLGYPKPDSLFDFKKLKTLFNKRYEHNSLFEDPMFVDVDNTNFRLLSNSPAWLLGFQAIAFDKIGLTPQSRFYNEQKTRQAAMGFLPGYAQ